MNALTTIAIACISLVSSFPAAELGGAFDAPHLVEGVLPPDVLVSDDGQMVVVFDAGESMGDHQSVVLYYGGEKVKSYRLEDIFSADEIAAFPRCRCLMNHRFWRGLVEITLTRHHTLLISRNGTTTLIDAEGTVTFMNAHGVIPAPRSCKGAGPILCDG